MKLHSLSISGLLTMNLHSLNNEGSEGNTMMTRMVEIIDTDGKNHTVNAISGDMFKHIQAEHLFSDATEKRLPLCTNCTTFNANRAGGANEVIAYSQAGQVDVEQFNDEDKTKYEMLERTKTEIDDPIEIKKIDKEMQLINQKYWIDTFDNEDKTKWINNTQQIETLSKEQKKIKKGTTENKKIQDELKKLKAELQDIEKKYRTTDSDLLDKILQICMIDDLEGFLLTSGRRSLPRKSCIEFSWAIGCPENVRTESYFHAKYVPEGRGKGSGAEENLGQNIFHRPASSGQYAIVVNVDLYKVGRNDITLSYADGVDRKERIGALLKSLLNTFLKPTGAHRNTQNPHILDFSGVIATSSSTLPAPVISGLNKDYAQQIQTIADNLNKIEKGNHITIQNFEGLAAFSGAMADIIEKVQPYGG